MIEPAASPSESPCILCEGSAFAPVATLRKRPPYETDYGIAPERYRRSIVRCEGCGVYRNVHDLLSSDFYTGAYNDASYGPEFERRYHAVRGLPQRDSDNWHRAQRVHRWLRRQFGPRPARVLDVGMGLCVFLPEVMALGHMGFGVDPDPMSVKQATEVAGVPHAHCGTLESVPWDEPFDLITFNKVLEHVPDPVRQLQLAGERLAEGGAVYLELPDGDGALSAGGVEGRGEFTLDHLLIYSKRSVKALAVRSGFQSPTVRAIVEPSGKRTLYAFIQPV